jgi:RNA polymerase sigma-70 factor, ECF subfamily
MARRDPDAFRELYLAHYRVVCRYLMARTSVDHVEDVAAETFLVAWRRQQEMPANVVPWLLGTARKVLANHRRSWRRAEALVDRIAAVAGSVSTMDAELTTRGQRRALVAAMASLGDTDRELLILRHWDDLPPRDISVVLEARPVLVRARLHRAERRLRESFAAALEEEGATAPQVRCPDGESA